MSFMGKSAPDAGHTSTRNAGLPVGPERWVDEHGNCLYRYALMRVRKPEVAEDFVQETLLAAFRHHQGFSRHSSERTWFSDASGESLSAEAMSRIKQALRRDAK